MEIKVINADAEDKYRVFYVPDVVYAERSNKQLKMQLLLQEMRPEKVVDKSHKHPLIVFARGSGWAGADSYAELPQLAELAHHGYVVASVEYRGIDHEDARYPDAIRDVKEAIRYLRANHDRYNIDPDRIAVMGDSSGGHTVDMIALSEGDEFFMFGNYQDTSDSVKAVVSLYGPTDFMSITQDRLDGGIYHAKDIIDGKYPGEGWRLFRDEWRKDISVLAEASPVNHIDPKKYYAPFLLIHGNLDPIIPFIQSVRFAERLEDAGVQVEIYCVEGGGHSVKLWTKEVMDIIVDFLDKNV